jgi:hypothetical protein
MGYDLGNQMANQGYQPHGVLANKNQCKHYTHWKNQEAEGFSYRVHGRTVVQDPLASVTSQEEVGQKLGDDYGLGRTQEITPETDQT